MKFSKAEEAMWLEDWRQSGKPAWTYAKENGLVPQTFYRWAAREKKTTQDFVEVPVLTLQTAHESQTAHEILIEKADVKIRIPLGLSNNELGKVIEGLKTALW